MRLKIVCSGHLVRWHLRVMLTLMFSLCCISANTLKTSSPPKFYNRFKIHSASTEKMDKLLPLLPISRQEEEEPQYAVS